MRERIARELKVPGKAVEVMEGRLSGRDQSTEAPVGPGGDLEWGDRLSDDGPSPEEIVVEMREGSTRSAWLAEALAQRARASAPSSRAGTWPRRRRS